MSYQLTTEELRRKAQRFLDYRARENPAAMPDPSADMTLVDCDGPTGSLLLAYDTKPWMANIMGVVHGGVIANLVDTCMGLTCGIQCRAMTPTISMTINYALPVPLNAAVRVRTRTVRCGGSVGQMDAEVFLADKPEELLVTATGAYSTRRREGSATPPWEMELGGPK